MRSLVVGLSSLLGFRRNRGGVFFNVRMVGHPYGGPWTGCAVETILRVARYTAEASQKRAYLPRTWPKIAYSVV